MPATTYMSWLGGFHSRWPWKQRTIAPILWLAHEFLSGAAIIGSLYGMAVRVRVPKLVRRD